MLPSRSTVLAEAIYFDIFANISFLPIHLCTWQKQFYMVVNLPSLMTINR